MKILLIDPPFYRILGFYNRYFPFGITMVATSLKNAGHEVMIYDADFFEEAKSIDYSKISENYSVYLESFKDKNNIVWKDVKKVIKKYKPDIVGISAYTDYLASTMFVAKIVKEIFPKIKVFVGGPHINVKAEEFMKICKSVDFSIIGEGEITSCELVNALENKLELTNIDGLVFRNKNDLIFNKKRKLLSNIDNNFMPNRSLLMNELNYSSEDMGLIMTSRGCPYNCSFCASNKNISFRPVDNVIDEIKDVKKKYSTTQFTFKDDSFTVDKKRIIEFCNKLIKEKINIKWECNTRVNLIDLDLLILMKKAGCNFIKVGIESGSEKVLNYINKGVTLSQIIKASRLFKKVGIHWSGYFMIGVINETIEDIYKTVSFIKEIKPDLVIMGTYQPYPGTKMFNDGINYGLIKEKMGYTDFYKMFPCDYYKINNKTQTNLIDYEEFKTIEKKVNLIVHKYNKKIFNVLKMAFAKLGVYKKDYKILFDDIRKYFKY